MNDAKYVEAYGHWEKSIPFSKPLAYRDALQALIDHASPEHEPQKYSEHMSDFVICACGWRSEGHWDGMDIAMRHWRNHVMEVIQGDPEDVGCGCS